MNESQKNERKERINNLEYKEGKKESNQKEKEGKQNTFRNVRTSNESIYSRNLSSLVVIV